MSDSNAAVSKSKESVEARKWFTVSNAWKPFLLSSDKSMSLSHLFFFWTAAGRIWSRTPEQVSKMTRPAPQSRAVTYRIIVGKWT